MALAGPYDIVKTVKAFAENTASKRLQEIGILIKNGMYYTNVNNPVSALVSYSNAATYIHAVIDAPSVANDKPTLQTVLAWLLGMIENLQEKVRVLAAGGNSGKDEEESNWDSLCVNMCEIDSKSLCLTFADVVGMKKEKNLMEINIIKPLVYSNLYTKSSKGVLLYGPPGTGKTYLVKAAIRELQNRFSEQVQVLFFNKTGADLKGKYVGETEKRIVEVYTCAARRACEMTDANAKVKGCASKAKETREKDEMEKKAAKQRAIENARRRAAGDGEEAKADEEAVAEVVAPAGQGAKKSTQYVSVIFIDEFDSIGRDRSADESGLAANAVNTLLQMMDGVESYKNVITVAATNNPWDLDAALLRRFNEHIYVKLPKFDDIKTLVKREMEDRFKLVETDMNTYCTTTVAKKGVYKTKAQVTKSSGTKDLCSKTNTSVFPLDIIDRSYQYDTSESMLAAVSQMAEKHYSNSDVSSVMQKAFNNVSEKCLQLGAWKKVTRRVENAEGIMEDKTYYISNFTKLNTMLQEAKDEDAKHRAANESIQQAAMTPSTYEVPNDANNKITYPTEIYLDTKELIKKNPFNIPETVKENGVDKTNPKLLNVLANIMFDGETYVNLKFINSPPSYLLFDDPAIHDIFLNPNDIYEKDNIDVIFTRVMNVTNDLTKATAENIDVITTNIAMLTENKANLNWEKEINYPMSSGYTGLRQTKFYTDLKAIEKLTKIRNAISGILKNLSDEAITSLKKSIKDGNVLYNDINSARYERQAKELIDLISTLIKDQEKTNVDDKDDINAKVVQLCASEGQENLDADMLRIVAYINMKGDVVIPRYLTEKALNMLTDALINTADEVIRGARDMLYKQPKGESIQKLFFFKSSIKVSSPEWTDYRTPSALTGVLSWAIGGLWSGLKGLVYTAEEKNTQMEVQEYIKSARVSTLDYLLARVTHFGISTGIKDKEHIYNAFDLPAARGGAVIRKTPHSRKNRTARNKTFRIKRNSKYAGTYNPDDLEFQDGGFKSDDYAIKWLSLDMTTEFGRGIRFHGNMSGEFAASSRYISIANLRNILTNRLPRMVGLLKGFEKEEDLSPILIVIKAMFSKEDFYVSTSQGKFDSIFDLLDTKFSELILFNYKKSLAELYNWFRGSITINKEMIPVYRTESQYNVKHIEQEDSSPDYSQFLSFFVDGSFLSGAIAEYPSTYNEKIVNMLDIYDKNRADFYARRDKGEFDKKK
jgi:SpoVK/Ycf46/Vps4 family AAA+-type ATPase